MCKVDIERNVNEISNLFKTFADNEKDEVLTFISFLYVSRQHNERSPKPVQSPKESTSS